MHRVIIILSGIALFVAAITCRFGRRFQHLPGWQKLLGVIALLLAAVILLSPEFAALGLLGDATFFDFLVMALSLQLLAYVRWVRIVLTTVTSKIPRWAVFPSPGARYLLMASLVAIRSLEKLVHRIWS